MTPAVSVARRYVAWLDRRALAIVCASLALLLGALYLIAFRLPLFADLSYLLPQDAPAVRGLRALEQRMVTKDTTIVIVSAPSPAARGAAADQVIAAARALPADLVDRVDADDRDIRDLVRAHKFLFLPLADLVDARDALAERIAHAKVRANPLFVDLDDDAEREQQAAADKKRLDELRHQRRDAEARLDRSSFVSRDDRMQMILIRTSFNTGDVDRARRLLPMLERVAADVRAAHPGVAIGFAGGVPTSVAEYGALVRGIVISSIITTLLVALVLLVHLRELRLLVLLGANIVVATIVSFGLAAVTVGHLNAATAFLGAVIAGNGINYGILLVARLLEERRAHLPAEALARAIAGTLRPTLVAALGAAVAYGALISTSFQGFANFGVIAGLGMLVCWIASFVLLPVLVLRFGGAVRTRERDSVFARATSLLELRSPLVVCAAGAAVVVAASAVTWRYVAHDPFEYDLAHIRSVAPDAIAARDWMKVADREFGRGLWTRTYVLVDDASQASGVVAALAASRETPDGKASLGAPLSMVDVVPPDQPKKLGVLAEIRHLLDDPGLDQLDEAERAELRELRPPDSLAPVTARDLPALARAELTERDGRLGTLVIVRPAAELDEYDGHQLLRLAHAVRTPALGHATVTGAGLIFADIITAIRNDGPRVTLVTTIGLAVMVVLLVGRNRRALAVMIGTIAGTATMVAACALLGLRVNFLDYISLPITLGLGIDYAINVADRAIRDDPRVALRMTGSTVLVCSLTTMIGYASLLASENLAIRGFGLASLIGEVTCVLAALILVPAVVSVGRLAIWGGSRSSP
jgi:predicted RND superfamily exporter protein